MLFQKLPNWIQFSAFLLALNAGLLNITGLLHFLNQPISHMSGNISQFAIALSRGDYRDMYLLLLILLCFMVGSFCSGCILGDADVKEKRRYGIPLILVSVFIFLAWLFISHAPQYALLCAATAMGLQNSMISHYRGAIIRTTHLSGVITDLGLAFGYLVRKLPVDLRRIALHVLILCGFLVGGILATVLHHYLRYNALLVPVALSTSLCLIYWLFYLHQEPYNSQ